MTLGNYLKQHQDTRKDRYEIQYCIQYYKECACMANRTLTSKL